MSNQITFPLLVVGSIITYFVTKKLFKPKRNNYKYKFSDIPAISENAFKKRINIHISKYRIIHTCGGVCDTDRINKKYNLSYEVIGESGSLCMANYVGCTIISNPDMHLSWFSVTHNYIKISCSEIDKLENVDPNKIYHIRMINE